MKEFFAKELLLGLTVQEFLLHLLNFVILFVALFFLLYKPVKKFMRKRKEDYEEADYEQVRQDIKNYRDNEHDSNADFTLAVLAFGLNAVNDEQGYPHSHKQFY